MRLVVALAALAAVVLVVAGCGGQGSAETAFRTKASQACREVDLHAKHVTGDSRRSVNEGLGILEDMADRLARVRPPAHDAHSYRDLIARVKDSTTFTKAHEAQEYSLLHRFGSEMKSFGRHLRSGDKAPPHFDKHLVERIDSLARRPLNDLRRAGNDARTLKLSACTFGVSSSVTVTKTKLQTKLTPIGTVTGP